MPKRPQSLACVQRQKLGGACPWGGAAAAEPSALSGNARLQVPEKIANGQSASPPERAGAYVQVQATVVSGKIDSEKPEQAKINANVLMSINS